MPMNLLTQLADETWSRLDELLLDLEYTDVERQSFVDDTKIFFEQRLSIYEKKKSHLDQQTQSLYAEIYRLADELDLDRNKFNVEEKLSIQQKHEFLRKEIDRLKNLINERNKELIQLRQSIEMKINLIGDIQIDCEQIISTKEAQIINDDLSKKLNQLKIDLEQIFNKIHHLNPMIAEKHVHLLRSFLSLDEENYSNWLKTNSNLNGSILIERLKNEFNNIYKTLHDEVVRLRQELNQNEPIPPIDLKQELEDLRLRQRYLLLLKDYPHKLNGRSTLDQIRQTYEQLTASLRAQAREKLKKLWDQLDVPENQRIIPKTKTNEDDYLAINDEIQRLEIYVESIRPVLTKIQKREWYKKEMVEFESRAGDPARLRGSSTQLLKEERFRKDLSREFPKLTDDLHRMVAEWEESTGKKLIYGGEPYLETMNKEKLSVDFELLHLRLLTKCQILVQPDKNESTNHQIEPILSPTPSLTPSISSICSTNSQSSTRSSSTRIPTPNFTTNKKKLQRPA